MNGLYETSSESEMTLVICRFVELIIRYRTKGNKKPKRNQINKYVDRKDVVKLS